MTSTPTLDVFVVAAEQIVADLTSEVPEVNVTALRPSEVTAALTERSPDCLVVDDVNRLDARTVERLISRGVPVVAYSDSPVESLAAREYVSGFVRPSSTDSHRRLLDELRWVTTQETRQQLRRSNDRVTRLHDATVTLAGVKTAQELFDQTVAVAADILDFDTCYVGIAEGEYIVPKAVSAGTFEDGVKRMRVDEGVAGYTYRHAESRLIRRVDEAPDARVAKDTYQSGISVPIDGHGVFQAVATRPEAFTETDLKLAELLISHVTATLDRIEAETHLRSERDRLDALFENVPDAAVEFEFDGDQPVVRRVNSTFERVFGYDADEILHERLDDYVLPETDDAEATTFDADLRSGESLRAEVRRLAADGPRDFLLHVVPIRLGEANLGGYAIYTDVTEQKERERELRRQNERLEEFTSIVSHDLRNPLTVADGYLTLARDDDDDPYLSKVATALDRMATLVDELLTLARKGQVVGETSTVTFADVVREAWAHVETDDVTLYIESDRRLDADRDRVMELLQNLFRNTVEHGFAHDCTLQTSEGGVERSGSGDTDAPGGPPTVRVEDTDEGFAVEDNGRGIPEEDRKRVFETGYTTAADGSGLGLAIVRRIAEGHGWSVRVTDGSEGGTRFEFRV